jgi:adenylosuccinate synthase
VKLKDRKTSFRFSWEAPVWSLPRTNNTYYYDIFVELQIAKESKDQIAKLIEIIKNGSTRGRYQIQKKRNNNKTVFFFVNRTHSYIYILFGYYPFTTGATTVGVTVVASLKLCTMQYKNIIDTLISTIIVNKSYCPLY